MPTMKSSHHSAASCTFADPGSNPVADIGPGRAHDGTVLLDPARRIAAHRRTPANEVGDSVAREGMIIWIDAATVSG